MISSSPKTRSAKSTRIKAASRGARSAGNDGSDVPAWAATAVFSESKVVAWEGPLRPLAKAAVYPRSGSFLQAVMPGNGRSLAWIDYVHPLDRGRVSKALAETDALPVSCEYRLVDKTGESVWIRHTVIRTAAEGNLAIGYGFVRNIQQEKELELESLRISEREQNRIGQDLHDDLCQVLAGVSCLMRVAEGRLASKVPEEVPYLAELNQQIVDAMHRTRALTHGLFPGKIQIADIRGAILELASQVRARFQVEVKAEFVGRFPQHNTNQIIQIYRLIQEAISNAVKHGHATCINVRLEARHANMSLSIIDNGTGLNQTEPTEKGVGHQIMQSRARSLGGELQIRNAADRGVAVSLTYPFQH